MSGFYNKQKVLKRLRALTPAVVKTVSGAVRDEAEDLADAMRRAAPVKSGALKASIRVEPTRDPFTFKVIAGSTPETRKKVRKGVSDADFIKARAEGGNKGEFDYPRAVEFGHIAPDGSHVAAEPFFYPTYRARKKGIKRRTRAKAKKAIKAAIQS